MALSPRADRGQSTDVTTQLQQMAPGTSSGAANASSPSAGITPVEFCTPKHLKCGEELEIHLGNAFREGKMRA